MVLRIWLRLVLAGLLFTAASAVAAQARDPEGLWALRADGRVLGLLELHRDPSATGRWTGQWIRPDRVTINNMHTAFDISGPIVRRPIRNGVARGDSIELTIQGREPDGESDVFIFRMVDADAAELSWKDVPIAPLALARAPAGTEVALDWDSSRHYALAAPPRRSNPEMAALFQADQAARLGGRPIDPSVRVQEDAARRARTRQLLNAGALQSADDYWHAAFIFQHGDDPNDFLMSHTLAVIAAARGRPDAAWIAAASLDRYLQRIGQKQIYGTQYQWPRGQPVTQEPYDRTLISDALRQALGVPPQAEQERQRAEFEAQARAQDN